MASNAKGPPTLFRELSPKDISSYVCDDDPKQTFCKLWGQRVRRIIVATEERYLTIPDSYNTPVGIGYSRGDNLYAMGISNKTGVIDTHQYTITVQTPIVYRMWGPYQRTPWTAFEITDLLVWRCRLMKEPRRIFNEDVKCFEKSRWMMFVFWEGKLEELISLEINLMNTIFDLDGRVGGYLKRNVGENIEATVREQYQSTFSLNGKEIDFNTRQSCWGKQVTLMLKSLL